MTRTAEDIVRTEVHYCVLSLVSTLANHPLHLLDNGRREPLELNTLCNQAAELTLPIDDWEEAARQSGFDLDDEGDIIATGDQDGVWADWQECCQDNAIEPYQREVFEHWIVSDWLADRLAEKGEKVDKDFAGLKVWARTQSDRAIQAIAAEQR